MIGPENQFIVPQWIEHDILMLLGICFAAIIHRYAEGWVDDIRAKKNGSSENIVNIPIDKETLLKIAGSVQDFAKAQSAMVAAIDSHAQTETDTNQRVRAIAVKVGALG